VTVTFEERDGKTRVTLHHASRSRSRSAVREQGWTEMLERLAPSCAQLSRDAPTPNFTTGEMHMTVKTTSGYSLRSSPVPRPRRCWLIATPSTRSHLSEPRVSHMGPVHLARKFNRTTGKVNV